MTGNDGFTVKERSKEVEFSGLRTKAVVSVRETQPEKSAIRLIFEEEGWDSGNYVFAPAALYNGNRFRSLPKEYAPMLTEKEAQQFAGETVITDVPRLDKGESGCVQLNVGDLSFPCVGYYCEKKKTGFLLFFEQKNELGKFGITVEENLEENTAKFILSSPCVRTPYNYGMCTTKQKSDDSGARLKKGDTVTFSFTEYRFAAKASANFSVHFLRFAKSRTCRAVTPTRFRGITHTS